MDAHGYTKELATTMDETKNLWVSEVKHIDL